MNELKELEKLLTNLKKSKNRPASRDFVTRKQKETEELLESLKQKADNEKNLVLKLKISYSINEAEKLEQEIKKSLSKKKLNDSIEDDDFCTDN